MNIKRRLAQSIERAWYERSALTLLLRPLSWLFLCIVSLRRFFYRHARS